MTDSTTYELIIYVSAIFGFAFALRRLWVEFKIGEIIALLSMLPKLPVLIEHIEKDENIYHVPRNWRNWTLRQIDSQIDEHVTKEHRRKDNPLP